MLFSGVELSQMTCSISVASEGYTFLGHKYFDFSNKNQLEKWIRSMVLSEDENIKWFFCEECYLVSEHHSFFSHTIASHTYHLVKDRIVKDFYHLICDLDNAMNRSAINLSLILAMSLKLFDYKSIRLYQENILF